MGTNPYTFLRKFRFFIFFPAVAAVAVAFFSILLSTTETDPA